MKQKGQNSLGKEFVSTYFQPGSPYGGTYGDVIPKSSQMGSFQIVLGMELQARRGSAKKIQQNLNTFFAVTSHSYQHCSPFLLQKGLAHFIGAAQRVDLSF